MNNIPFYRRCLRNGLVLKILKLNFKKLENIVWFIIIGIVAY